MEEETKKEQTTNANVDDGQEQSEDGKDTKVYMTQEEVDAVIEKRLSREHKKQGKKSESSNTEKDESHGKPESKQQDNGRLEALEAKLICYDAGVNKECVSDVVALAKAYADEDTTFEEAVEKVLKKYPQFQNATSKEENQEEDKTKGAWGKRQSKSLSKEVDGVEEAFLKRNPGLKIN